MPDLAAGFSYATVEDFISILTASEGVEQSDLDNPQELMVDREVLEASLVSATGRVNAKLAGRYLVPITPIPPILVTYTVWLSNWAREVYQVREAVDARQIQVIADLERIASGDDALIGADGRPITPLPAPVDPNVIQRFNSATYVGNRTNAVYIPQFGGKTQQLRRRGDGC